MYKKILDSMRQEKDKVSFFERMEAMQNFLDKHNLMKLIQPEMPNTPISIVWAVIDPNIDLFIQGLNAFLQFDNIFIPGDQIIFVCDKGPYNEVKNLIEKNKLPISHQVIGVDRGQLGNRPGFNWDLGVPFADNDRVLFIKDGLFFFNPWELIRTSRFVEIDKTLVNFSTIFGYHYSSVTDKWVYLVHSKFSPTSILFCFVTSKQNWLEINGFDLVFRRGFDNLGELDLMLRWGAAGFNYTINDDVLILQNAISFNPDQIETVKLTTAIPRRYFFDRWGEEFIQKLDFPCKLEIQVPEVQQCLTYSDIMTIAWENKALKPPTTGLFDFAKLSLDKFIIKTEIIE